MHHFKLGILGKNYSKNEFHRSHQLSANQGWELRQNGLFAQGYWGPADSYRSLRRRKTWTPQRHKWQQWGCPELSCTLPALWSCILYSLPYRIRGNFKIYLISNHNSTYLRDFHTLFFVFSLLNQDVRSIQPVELQVTNLDQNIEQREMKRTITNIFREHVPILHVSVFFQSDGNMAASVRVPTPQDAQYAISQLHRKKVFEIIRILANL